MALGLTPKEIIDSGSHPLLECSNEWKRIELNKIAEVQNGFAFKSEYFNHESGLPLIRIRDVGKSEAEELYSGDYDDDYLVNKGDILIGMDGDFRAAYWTGEPGLLNQRVCRIRNIDDSYSKKFLYYLLQPYLEAIHAETSAVTVKHLSSRTIQSIPLPNPPLPTQYRIVEKIEELFSELDNGVENLKKARQQLKTYRQAVLKDAFEGKLTKEWREQQTDLPTPEELLQQIKAERKAHRQRELAEWKKEVEQWEKGGEPGRKPRKPRKLDQYDQLTEKQIDILNEIPKDWLWIKVGNICPSIVPNRDKPKSFSGDIPWLTTPDIDPKKISIDLKKVDQGLTPGEVEKYNARLIPSDSVIMTCVGSFGVICVNRISCVCNQQLHAFITENLINPSYLAYALKEKKPWMEKEATSTTVSYLNKTKANSTPIPLCSEQEQKEIVNEIESRLSVVDQLEQTIKENLQKAEALRQSILKKAFGGELVYT